MLAGCIRKSFVWESEQPRRWIQWTLRNHYWPKYFRIISLERAIGGIPSPAIRRYRLRTLEAPRFARCVFATLNASKASSSNVIDSEIYKKSELRDESELQKQFAPTVTLLISSQSRWSNLSRNFDTSFSSRRYRVLLNKNMQFCPVKSAALVLIVAIAAISITALATDYWYEEHLSDSSAFGISFRFKYHGGLWKHCTQSVASVSGVSGSARTCNSWFDYQTAAVPGEGNKFLVK